MTTFTTSAEDTVFGPNHQWYVVKRLRLLFTDHFVLLFELPVFSRGGYPPPAFLVFSVDFLNEHLLYLKFIVNFYVLGLSMSMSYSNRVPPPPWGPPRCKSDRFASQWLDASKFSRESNFILLDFRADAYLQLFGYIFEIFSSRSFEEYQCWNSFILISKLVENVFKNIVYINIPSVAY